MAKIARLRDTESAEERELLEMIEDTRQRLFAMWLFELKWDKDFKELAKVARVHPMTVQRFVLGLTREPRLGTVVRLAHAAGFRVTFVRHNAPVQEHEVRRVRNGEERVRKLFDKKEK